MTISASDLGTGRKVFFPIPLKQKPIEMSDFLYVYAESKLVGDPQELEVGYTEADVITAAGVYVFKKVRDRTVGQVYALDVLFREVITDLSLRNRIIYRVNEMKNMIRLDEEFLELANMERASRAGMVKRLH